MRVRGGGKRKNETEEERVARGGGLNAGKGREGKKGLRGNVKRKGETGRKVRLHGTLEH
jgi:hypothetical protein